MLGETREGYWHVCRWKSRENAEATRHSFAMPARYTVERVPLRVITLEERELNVRYHTAHAKTMRRAEDEVARSVRCKIPMKRV